MNQLEHHIFIAEDQVRIIMFVTLKINSQKEENLAEGNIT
jgi:hypothetical protein